MRRKKEKKKKAGRKDSTFKQKLHIYLDYITLHYSGADEVTKRSLDKCRTLTQNPAITSSSELDTKEAAVT